MELLKANFVKTLIDLLFNKIDRITRFEVSVHAYDTGEAYPQPQAEERFLIEVDFINSAKNKDFVRSAREALQEQCFTSFIIKFEEFYDDGKMASISFMAAPKL